MKQLLAPALVTLILVISIVGVALVKNQSTHVGSHNHETEEDAPYTPEEIAQLREYYRSDPNVFACVEDDGSATVVSVSPVSSDGTKIPKPGGLPCENPL